ncbi:MAG: hypothetical protein AAB969_00935, partial [Patescibacteria group bacterium]
KERAKDLGIRYQYKGFPKEEHDKFTACGEEMEKQIFAKCKIKPGDINDEAIKPIISNLRNFVIE